MTTVATSIKLDPETRERLARLAETRQRTVHWLMAEAIREYVVKEERRGQLRQAALDAWHEFELTGLHVAQDEADAWLAALEAGETREPPEAHA